MVINFFTEKKQAKFFAADNLNVMGQCEAL